mgnify:CR=1 FL=1
MDIPQVDKDQQIARADKMLAEQVSTAEAGWARSLAAIGMADGDSEKPWTRHGGVALEPSLRMDPQHGAAPVRLIDARYLVGLADRGELLMRRQDLPETAFISLDKLQSIRGEGVSGMLRVLVISYPWLQVRSCHQLPDVATREVG